jgi:F-type H+-transporting ATPase subunit gamma
MANLKEVRNRITSVISTQQITKAMKMVSAAKLRRAQDAIIRMRPYSQKLQEILQNLAQSLDASDTGAYSKVRPLNNVLFVAINSNRGLCGASNTNVIRKINILLASDEYSALNKEGKIHIMAIGKKASDFFSKRKKIYSFAGEHNHIYDDLTFNNTSVISESIMQEFISEKYDRVILIYNQFKNAAVQNVQAEQMLPIEPPATTEENVQKHMADYIFEPSKQEILLDLVPKTIKIQLFKAILDSHASEHGARMTAMSKATDNADDLLKDLRLTYNKARQAAITGEILEIVAGAEALEK